MIGRIQRRIFLKTNSYSFYALNTFIILFLLAIQWYLAATLVLIKALYTIIRKKIDQQTKQTRRAIANYPWHELHRNVQDSLELIKYTKMIGRGYDSKTNTNIILHEERQHSSVLKFSIGEETLISSYVSIMKVLQKLYQIKTRMFKEQSQTDVKEAIGKIQSFKELFAANRAADLIITQLWEMSDFLRTQTDQPLLDQLIRYDQLRVCKSQILPLLLNLTKEHQLLQQNRRKYLQGFKLKPQYQQILDLFTSNTYKEEKLQALMRKIQQLEHQANLAELQKPVVNNYSILQSESKQQIPVKIQHKHQTEQPSPSQRKQFMKKLNAQLMMGLAKRRQQQFERTMKLQEQSDVICQ